MTKAWDSICRRCQKQVEDQSWEYGMSILSHCTRLLLLSVLSVRRCLGALGKRKKGLKKADGRILCKKIVTSLFQHTLWHILVTVTACQQPTCSDCQLSPSVSLWNFCKMPSNIAWQQTLVHDDASSCVICQINTFRRCHTSIVNISANLQLRDRALHSCAPNERVT